MTIKLLDSNSKIKRTIARVSSVLVHSNGDLHIIFEDCDEYRVSKDEYSAFIIKE